MFQDQVGRVARRAGQLVDEVVDPTFAVLEDLDLRLQAGDLGELPDFEVPDLDVEAEGEERI